MKKEQVVANDEEQSKEEKEKKKEEFNIIKELFSMAIYIAFVIVRNS